LQAASSSGATTTTPANLEQEEIPHSLPSPVKMPRSDDVSNSFDIAEDDFSDLSFLPSVGSDDLP
jgi:hypothetical protein